MMTPVLIKNYTFESFGAGFAAVEEEADDEEPGIRPLIGK